MKGLIYKFVMAMGMLMASATASATVTYVYTDPQGTSLAEADASGTITATFDYKPYGSQALGSPKAGPGYTGHVNDPDTGFVYMQARYCDPVVGRFLSTDPVRPKATDVLGFGRYADVQNNQVINVDLSGKYHCNQSKYGDFCE
jgi:RHS repeat-associated protein